MFDDEICRLLFYYMVDSHVIPNYSMSQLQYVPITY